MNNQHQLEKLFEQARNALPVMSFSESERLVQREQPLQQTSSHSSNYYRRGIMVASIVGIIGLIASVLIWENQREEMASNPLSSSISPYDSQQHVVTSVPIDSNPQITAQQQKPQKRFASQRPGTILGSADSLSSSIKNKTAQQKLLGDSLYVASAVFIAGIKIIELTDDELEKVGVTRDKGDVWIQKIQDDRSVTKLGKRVYSALEKQSSQRTQWTALLRLPSVYPLAVTDDIGNQRFLIGSIEEDSLQDALKDSISDEDLKSVVSRIKKLSRQTHSQLISGDLIPILVRTGRQYTEADRLAKRWRPDCILWFRPTSAFLQALPERVRYPVECQLKLGESLRAKPAEEQAEQFIERSGADRSCVADAETSASSINSPIPGQAFIDTWRSAAGAITESAIIASPEGQSVQFRLVEPRIVSLALYNIHGRFVHILSAPQHRDRGQIVEQLNLQDISSGIYLLTIQTDHGERAVQRIMVENKSATLR